MQLVPQDTGFDQMNLGRHSPSPIAACSAQRIETAASQQGQTLVLVFF